jgi:hypothetical protein
MARSYGRFTTDIWRDPKFRALEMDQQWSYFMLGTQADISAAGMLPCTIKRWSGYASDATPDRTSDALSALVVRRFVVIDTDTEELLVRAFAKWDGGLNNRNRRPVVIEAIHAIASPVLRHVMALELRDLGEPEEVWHALSDAPTDAAWHAPTDALPDTPSTSDRVVVSTSLSPSQPSTHNPQPATPIPAAPRAPRGTRLPEDWRPSAEEVQWARGRGIPDEQSRSETEKFINFWLAKSGKDATKLDWTRTWRNWLITATERDGLRHAAAPATAKAQGWLSLAVPDEQYAIEGEPA